MRSRQSSVVGRRSLAVSRTSHEGMPRNGVSVCVRVCSDATHAYWTCRMVYRIISIVDGADVSTWQHKGMALHCAVCAVCCLLSAVRAVRTLTRVREDGRRRRRLGRPDGAFGWGFCALSIDALTADVGVDGDLETRGMSAWAFLCRMRGYMHGCNQRMRWVRVCAWMRGCGCDAMRCDAMRCDTPPDIVEQTTHERKNSNSGSFNNQIR
jgi:hypothetical protein